MSDAEVNHIITQLKKHLTAMRRLRAEHDHEVDASRKREYATILRQWMTEANEMGERLRSVSEDRRSDVHAARRLLRLKRNQSM